MGAVTKLFESWFNEITLGDSENTNSYIQKVISKNESILDEIKIKFKFYTDNYEYTVSAIERIPKANKRSYLGCTMNCRKSRPGEDWIRGNDLPDGLLNEVTWNRIKNAIIRNELVKLAPKRKEISDTL